MIGRTISHYRIVEKLGEGGMGVVYLAEDTVLGRRVAIKTLTSARGPVNQHFRMRFLREAQAISKLSHAHIANIYDYGETESGEPYIVMELVEGKILADLIKSETLTIPRTLEIIKQVAEALEEAHGRGIVHRDIKPSNIAINERGKVKVLDFGLAKHVTGTNPEAENSDRQEYDQTRTREGVIVGTPMYLSPEQALGVPVDSRSDLFSLGAVLYECIAGRPAFSGKSDIDICAKVIRDDPPPPSQFNSVIPAELDQLTLKALAKKPEDRCQSANDLITHLQAAERSFQTSRASDHPILTVPSPTVDSVLDTPRTRSGSSVTSTITGPRVPIGYVMAGVALLAVIGYVAWRATRATPHVPKPEAQQLYVTGTNAIRAGSFFQASKALELATGADDRFALAHARLADALMELDYFDRAKDEILRASELTPDRSVLDKVDNLYLDALTSTVRRNFPATVSAYSQIAQLQPEKAEVHFDLGRAYEKDNQTNKAVESYVEATKRDTQYGSAFLRLGVLYGRKREMDSSRAAFDKAEQIYESLGNVEGRTEVALQRGVLLNDIVQKPDDARVQLEHAREMAKVGKSLYQQVRILYQLSNVALKQRMGAEAKEFATQALELAQANQMETLIARGYNEIGNVDFALGDYANAEHNFQQGLGFAQKFGARQNEARARLSLASLNVQRGEGERALGYLEPALNFYQSAGFRTETNQAMNLRARIYRYKGDYNSALKSLDDQLKFAQQTNDHAQVALAQASIGNVLLDQEKYAEALESFEQSYAIQKSLNNQLQIGYALLNRGAAHWRLGRDEEARRDLGEATTLAGRDDAAFKELQAHVLLVQAQMSLADRDFRSAIDRATQANALAGEQVKIVRVRAGYLMGLAQSLAGQTRVGQKACEEATEAAASLNDPPLVARARLALAEASLVAGDNQRAITAAQESRAFFTSAALAEAEWRAWLIEGLATQKAGEHEKAQSCRNRASELLASLEQKWGGEVFQKYINRPDIRVYQATLKR